MTRTLLLALLAALAVAGCGEQEPSAPGSSDGPNALVDTTAEPPLINGLDADPETGELLLTTNKGFFRIDPESDEVTRIEGKVVADTKEAPVGTFLYVNTQEPGRWIGSGHPDNTALPNFLGFIESTDEGKTWKVLARLGEADLHKIEIVDGRMHAFDAVLGAMLVSDDGGQTFTERFTPRGLIIDFAVNPQDPEEIYAANESQLFHTTNGGESWRPVATGEGIRLAWPASDALYRVDRTGAVQRSADGGKTFDEVGRVEGEAYKLKPIDAEHVYLAMADATILETTDGGRTWDVAFKP